MDIETVIVNGKKTPKSKIRPLADILESMQRQHTSEVVISAVDRDVLLEELKRLNDLVAQKR